MLLSRFSRLRPAMLGGTPAAVLVLLGVSGCGGSLPLPPSGSNTTDPTNGGAFYIGSAACGACHPGFAATQVLTGHSQILKQTDGAPPSYPAGLGVPQPPPGRAWTDVNYVVGGYLKAASFIDRQGYLLSDGLSPPLAYYLAFSANGTQAGFTALNDHMVPQPYASDCFRCHTTGPQSVADNGGRRQNNLPGIGGTWTENGVQCEACHGPGSHHVPDPRVGNIFLDGRSTACARCHDGLGGGSSLAASGGYIVGNQQVGEIAVSPHSGFACTVCHDPHNSVFNGPGSGLRNTCTNCHDGTNMALHQGKTFVRGDEVEPLECQSCHMPFASKYATSAADSFFGATPARMGDTRTHIFFIQTADMDFEGVFTPDGSEVAINASGRAAVTLDFVCLRCHNGQGSAFALSLAAVSGVAGTLHQLHQ